MRTPTGTGSSAAAVPNSTTVLIIGAGPTGLTLANALARRDVPFVVVDKRPTRSSASRGCVLHSRTLEILDDLGVGNALVDQGVVMPRFSMHRRRGPLLTVPFHTLPGAHGHSVSVPQNITEGVLTDALGAAGYPIHRGLALENIAPGNGADPGPPNTTTRGEWLDHAQPGGLVAATLVDSAGSTRQVTATVVVGCDGLHSQARQLAGIGFTGTEYGHQFKMADVTMDWPLPADGVDLIMSPNGVLVVFPLPRNRFRVIAMVGGTDEMPGNTESDPPTVATMQQLLDSRGPLTGAGQATNARVHQVHWSTQFGIESRLASSFRRGPVLLAGDAAHVYSPAGGQGMNLGIRDAASLGETLTAVLRGNAGWAALDEWAGGRRRVAEDVVAFTDRLTRAVTARNSAARLLRNTALRVVSRTPAPRKIALKMSGHNELFPVPAVLSTAAPVAVE